MTRHLGSWRGMEQITIVWWCTLFWFLRTLGNRDLVYTKSKAVNKQAQSVYYIFESLTTRMISKEVMTVSKYVLGKSPLQKSSRRAKYSTVQQCAQFYKYSCWNVNYTKIFILVLTYARRKTQSSHNLFLESTSWRKDLHTTDVFPFFDTCQFITINTTNYCDDTRNDRFNSHLSFKNIIMMMAGISTFVGCCVCVTPMKLGSRLGARHLDEDQARNVTPHVQWLARADDGFSRVRRSLIKGLRLCRRFVTVANEFAPDQPAANTREQLDDVRALRAFVCFLFPLASWPSDNL